MNFLQALNSDISVLIVCNKTGGTIKGDKKTIGELVEVGRRYGMECGKTGHENLKTIIRRSDYGRPKATGECGMRVFQIFSSLDVKRYAREIKFRMTMAKAAFSKKKTIFTSKLDSDVRKKLFKWYIWSIFMVLKLGLFGKYIS